MNAFAAAYNAYVAGVQQGLVDLKKWQAALQAWRRLNRSSCGQ
jgi:phage-related minor tail protein